MLGPGATGGFCACSRRLDDGCAFAFEDFDESAALAPFAATKPPAVTPLPNSRAVGPIAFVVLTTARVVALPVAAITRPVVRNTALPCLEEAALPVALPTATTAITGTATAATAAPPTTIAVFSATERRRGDDLTISALRTTATASVRARSVRRLPRWWKAGCRRRETTGRETLNSRFEKKFALFLSAAARHMLRELPVQFLGVQVGIMLIASFTAHLDARRQLSRRRSTDVS